MQRLLKATQLTSGPSAAIEISDHELAQLYAYPADLRRPYLRANMIASLDGSAVVDGRSGGLGGAGDRRLFEMLRHLAEVLLVGSGTVNGEQYHPDPRLRIAIVSSSLRVSAPVLEDRSVIILTCQNAPADRRAELVEAGLTVIDCGVDHVYPPSIVEALGRLGLLRVLTEGGPSLLGSLLSFGLVDEMSVTTAPFTVAGNGTRIVVGTGPDQHFLPQQVLTDDDGYLYTRWTTRQHR